jgi:putative phosphoesterase
MRIGLISDTHGWLRSEALAALHGSDCIIHAGDIGDASILARLAAIAPVTAVRGNNDQGEWATRLPETNRLDVDGVRILVIHDVAALAFDPAAAGIDVVVSGHSHRPASRRQGAVLFINPGSAGPRRFRLPVSVGRLDIAVGRIDAALVSLDVETANATPATRGRRVPR